MRGFLFLVIFYGCWSQAWAMPADTSHTGVVKGQLRDTANDIDLLSATVAIYHAQDSTLIGYQLADGFGEFLFPKVPAGVRLKLVASYMGYESSSVLFMVDGEVNLGVIALQIQSRQLQGVSVITPPPVRVNGDTLEFFADAFSVYKNAVVEDLLVRLPGVTVWGDGQITVNGRKVSQVLVNGKPFFGGNTNIAIKNIPKDAVERVQVYTDAATSGRQEDSTTNVNIQLKADKSTGTFGKVSAGYGTDNRYDADASLNMFNRRSELLLVAGANNVNKVADHIDDLQENSVYSSNGVSMNYQPNFSMPGANRPIAGGALFTHDFISNPGKNNVDRIKGTYFIRDNEQINLRDVQTVLLSGSDSLQQERRRSELFTSGTVQDAHVRYDKKKNFYQYYLSAGLHTDKNSSSEWEQLRRTFNDKLLSTGSQHERIHNDDRRWQLEAGFTSNKPSLRPAEVEVRYTLSFDDRHAIRNVANTFSLSSDTGYIRDLHRHYTTRRREATHQLNASFGDLVKWWPAEKRPVSGLSAKITNALQLVRRDESQLTRDESFITGERVVNPRLTNDMQAVVVDERPALSVEKTISRHLPDRYAKDWGISLQLQGQYYFQQTKSSLAYQNISRSYVKPTPNVAFTYNNFQVGGYHRRLKFALALSSEYPTIGQLVGLVDSIDPFFIRQSNAGLRESDKRELRFSFQHSSLHPQKVFSFNIDASAGTIDNAISDSIHIDDSGRSVYGYANMDGRLYANVTGKLSTAVKWDQHQFHLTFNTGLNLFRTPSFVNGDKIWSDGYAASLGTTIHYDFLEHWSAYWENGVRFYAANQQASQFRNSTGFSKLALSTDITRKLSLGSNITVNRATTSGFSPNTFSIWNASVAYRFLEGDNLEIRCSALDLLRQNRSIVNEASLTMLTRGTSNVLQQYFMISLSWFPRKFGKEE
ncbi:hypothetical protein MKQ68_25240 [Chitinophaga horti]|uniref:Outer membrane protein beta-barrel domain-containing protein n=1 Tax=Chitinophaga horti TaxID=2920382 RepID=A0ABY6J1W9_9BACT|nr:hypothetical protein [Chitinophaga horti]UYQ93391.1 hypothetical protein MKQ68_25240 [Chitinophaga horti]